MEVRALQGPSAASWLRPSAVATISAVKKTAVTDVAASGPTPQYPIESVDNALKVLLLLAGGVFAAEALSVIIQTGAYRWRKKRHGKEYADQHRVFRMSPLHHHFEKLGWAEPLIVTRFYILGVLCAAIALATLKVR